MTYRESPRRMSPGAARRRVLIGASVPLLFVAHFAGFAWFHTEPLCSGSPWRDARLEVSNLDGMVQQQMLTRSPPRSPDRLEQLTQGPDPITSKIPEDPWGNAYVYRKTGDTTYAIFSAGPDGIAQTDDDIAADRGTR